MTKPRRSSPEDREKVDRMLEQAKEHDESGEPERRPGIRGKIRDGRGPDSDRK